MAGGWSRLFGWGLAGFWFSFFRSLANPSEWVRVVSSLGSSVPDLFVYRCLFSFVSSRSCSRARVTPASEASRRLGLLLPKKQ